MLDRGGLVDGIKRDGAVRVIKHGKLLPQPYLTIPVSIVGAYSEQGLVGIAFDPNFASSGIFYLAFTAPYTEPRLGALSDQVLARFVASDPGADVFPGSIALESPNRTDVLRIPDIYNNHNGGDIHFGPDGYLYWGMGDGGSGGDPNNFAQNLFHEAVDGHDYYLLGKMLRLDVRNGTTEATSETCGKPAGQTLQYKIPADNPFADDNDTGTCDEIYAYGLRNPWRFSFDRDTHDMYIADVGQDCWEEVDVAANGVKGLNFGWKVDEGHATYPPPSGEPECQVTPATISLPIFDYSHDHGCSITGGYVYRSPSSELGGLYFYGDFCKNTLFYADADDDHWHDGAPGISGTPLSTNLDLGSGPVGFGEDVAGRVYVTLNNGTIYRIDSDRIFGSGFEQ